MDLQNSWHSVPCAFWKQIQLTPAVVHMQPGKDLHKQESDARLSASFCGTLGPHNLQEALLRENLAIGAGNPFAFKRGHRRNLSSAET